MTANPAGIRVASRSGRERYFPAEPMRNDLHLSDWQLRALTGLAFALIYLDVCMPP